MLSTRMNECSVTSAVSDSLRPWNVAHQAPLSMGVSWQEYWGGLLFPPLEDLPNAGIKAVAPALAGRFLTN